MWNTNTRFAPGTTRLRQTQHSGIADARHRHQNPSALAIPHRPVARLESLQNHFIAWFEAGRETVCALSVMDAGFLPFVDANVVTHPGNLNRRVRIASGFNSRGRFAAALPFGFMFVRPLFETFDLLCDLFQLAINSGDYICIRHASITAMFVFVAAKSPSRSNKGEKEGPE